MMSFPPCLPREGRREFFHVQGIHFGALPVLPDDVHFSPFDSRTATRKSDGTCKMDDTGAAGGRRKLFFGDS